MLVIIKPTYNCNLCCSYCYAESIRKNDLGKRLSLETLQIFFENFFHYCKDNLCTTQKVSFLWHGGEPMLLPTAYFEEALRLQKSAQRKLGTHFRVSNRIQSNLTLIDTEWVNFLSKHKWTVATSLDGPKDLHDSNRYFPSKRGSFDQVLSGIDALRAVGVGVGAVCVLTRNGIDRIADIYHQFNRIGVSFRFNALSYGGGNNYDNDCIQPEEYAKALIELFDLWYWDQSAKIKITTLVEISTSLLTRNSRSCSFSANCCERIIALGADSNLYPCGRFCGDKNFILGNVDEQSVAEILGCNCRQKLLSRNSKIIIKCSDCDDVDYCKSGCMHDSWYANNDIFTPTPFCEAYKTVFHHIKKNLTTIGFTEKGTSEQSGIFD